MKDFDSVINYKRKDPLSSSKDIPVELPGFLETKKEKVLARKMDLNQSSELHDSSIKVLESQIFSSSLSSSNSKKQLPTKGS